MAGPTRESSRLEFEYDGDTDVLFACVASPPATFSEPAALDFFVLHDAATDRILGIECVDFSRHIQDEAWLQTLPETVRFYSPAGRPTTVRAMLQLLWREIRRRASGPVNQDLALTGAPSEDEG